MHTSRSHRPFACPDHHLLARAQEATSSLEAGFAPTDSRGHRSGESDPMEKNRMRNALINENYYKLISFN